MTPEPTREKDEEGNVYCEACGSSHQPDSHVKRPEPAREKCVCGHEGYLHSIGSEDDCWYTADEGKTYCACIGWIPQLAPAQPVPAAQGECHDRNHANLREALNDLNTQGLIACPTDSMGQDTYIWYSLHKEKDATLEAAREEIAELERFRERENETRFEHVQTIDHQDARIREQAEEIAHVRQAWSECQQRCVKTADDKNETIAALRAALEGIAEFGCQFEEIDEVNCSEKPDVYRCCGCIARAALSDQPTAIGGG